MTRTKRVQEDFEKKEDSSPRAIDGVLNEKDQALKKVKVPTDGNSMPKKEEDKKKKILTSP